MMERLASLVAAAITKLYGEEIAPNVARTDETHGDFATNAAMQLAGKLQKSPREFADALASTLQNSDEIESVSVAGPGFINIRVKDSFLSSQLEASPMPKAELASILLEYSCPNAFKELHTGHLYQTLIGDAIARVYEAVGTKVYRTSFGGDVGLHAAKCMWGMLAELGGEEPEKLQQISERSTWIANAYVAGSKAYEADETAKAAIDQLNKRIYQLFEAGDTTSPFAQIFFTTRQWSYDYFDDFYDSIGAVAFDRYYPESETLKPGLELVNANIGNIFTESDGAIVLDEAKTGLHTRVFVTSAGLPTYETKDLGVVSLEADQFDYEKRVIMTGNDQSQYMQVVFAAINLIDPPLGAKQSHVANGTVRFGDGKKMSSRLGNVSRAVDVVEAVESAVDAKTPEARHAVALGAIKYSLLKSRVGGDIAFDLDQSISTEGNSGPYLQYALVRARSILRSANSTGTKSDIAYDEHERRLAIKLSAYGESISETINDFSPHHICTYLYELAQVFNRFYENCRVLDDPRTDIRLGLVSRYEAVLAGGLELLGVPTLEEM